jgi:hypothetical protein
MGREFFLICFSLIRLAHRLKRIVVHYYEDHGCRFECPSPSSCCESISGYDI